MKRKDNKPRVDNLNNERVATFEKSLSDKRQPPVFAGMGAWYKDEDEKEAIKRLFCKENEVGVRESSNGKEYKIYLIEGAELFKEMGEGLV